jgi:ABC-type phosphate transport system substrate-binding protein
VALTPQVLVAALALLAAPDTGHEPCRVIVNAANPAIQIQRAALVSIYMGQMTRWSDGKAIAPVDQSVRSPVRIAFSEKVLGKSVQSVQNTWMKKMAAEGAIPPLVKPSDAEVAAYVRAHDRAIGYVAPDFALDDGIRVLKVVNEAKPQGGVR